MRILSLETSGASGSVAALEEQRVRAEMALDPAERTARTLAPAMREVLEQVGWLPRDVQLVAVAAGPGSFTGLRLGVTTAKTFAYAVGAEVLGVNTLEVLAAQAPPECFPLEVALDAQRQQVFAGSFSRGDPGPPQWSGTTRIVDIDEWLDNLREGVWLTGPILARLTQRLPAHVQVVPAEHWQPAATAVGRVAWQQYQAGRRDDLWRLVPLYLRKSAAEEKAGK